MMWTAYPGPLPRFQPVSLLSCPSTYFGKEAEVAVHTHLDSHRVEKPSNHWMLVTGNPRKDSSAMLDLPKPPAEAPPALEQATDPGAQ